MSIYLFVCLSKICQVKNLRNCERVNWNVTGCGCQQAVVAISKQNRDRIDWTGRLLYCPRFELFCRIRSKDFLPTDCRYETCHPAGITVNILTFSKQREVFFFKLVPSSLLVWTPTYLDAVLTEFYETRSLTTASALSLPSATQYGLRPHPILLYRIFHIISLSPLRSPIWSLSFSFINKCYKPRPSHDPWFHHPNNIR
jgi:hypothetical protein